MLAFLPALSETHRRSPARRSQTLHNWWLGRSGDARGASASDATTWVVASADAGDLPRKTSATAWRAELLGLGGAAAGILQLIEDRGIESGSKKRCALFNHAGVAATAN